MAEKRPRDEEEETDEGEGSPIPRKTPRLVRSEADLQAAKSLGLLGSCSSESVGGDKDGYSIYDGFGVEEEEDMEDEDDEDDFPDLASYLDGFGVPKAEQIQLCRSYANYLVKVAKVHRQG